jgi:hypothetical protein
MLWSPGGRRLAADQGGDEIFGAREEHEMKRTPLRFPSCLLAVAALVAAAPALAAPNVADVSLGTLQVEWQPAGDFAGMKLRVSGPMGVFERDFAAGENPLFDLRSLESAADGLYTWEIVAAPRLDDGVRRAIAEARAAGDPVAEGRLRASGALPDAGSLVQSGHFRVVDGAILQPSAAPEAPAAGIRRVTSEAGSSGIRRVTAADQVIPDDLIVQGSICAGFDCVNNENFGFDTIRMKENNTRIKFEDTSVGTFPSTDWQLTANDSASGGANKFSIEDITSTRVPFTITGGATTNSIFVASTGRVGFRTSTPVLDLHVSTSNTPGIRLEQNSSGGFTAQTWDVAGNEANFFVRSVTTGSQLPFRIRPGAPSSSIDISADGDVGFGTASPDAAVDIERGGAGAAVTMLRFTNTNGPSRLEFRDNTGAIDWDFRTTSGDTFVITQPTSPTNDFQINSAGDVSIRGTLTTAGSCSIGCDLVFSPDYELPSIEEHAEQMWLNSHLPAVGPTPEEGSFNLTDKTLRMLNELEKAHIYIAQLNERVKQKDDELISLQERLAALEEALAELDAQP